MSSRKTYIHIVSTTQPVNANPGDEWFNPSTNVLYKLLYTSTTALTWVIVDKTQ